MERMVFQRVTAPAGIDPIAIFFRFFRYEAGVVDFIAEIMAKGTDLTYKIAGERSVIQPGKLPTLPFPPRTNVLSYGPQRVYSNLRKRALNPYRGQAMSRFAATWPAGVCAVF